jgi:hypothetical protein
LGGLDPETQFWKTTILAAIELEFPILLSDSQPKSWGDLVLEGNKAA